MFEKLMFWKKHGLDSLTELDQTASLNGSNPFASSADMHAADANPFGQAAIPTTQNPFSSTQDLHADPFAQSAFIQPGFALTPPSSTPQQFGSAAGGISSQYNYGSSSLPQRSTDMSSNSANAGSGSSIHPRDVELILARLDTIRAEIENISHRLSAFERQNKGW